MSIQKRILQSIPVEGAGEATHVDVELYYSKGGMNYFSGRNEARGLYISVQPLSKGDRWTSFVAYSGFKQHVKEMKMFTQKALDSFVPDPELVQKLISHVIEKSGLRVKEMAT